MDCASPAVCIADVSLPLPWLSLNGFEFWRVRLLVEAATGHENENRYRHIKTLTLGNIKTDSTPDLGRLQPEFIRLPK